MFYCGKLILNSNAITKEFDAIFFSKVSLNSFTNNTCIGFTKRKLFTEKKNGTSKNILNVKYDTLMLFTNIDIKFFES